MSGSVKLLVLITLSIFFSHLSIAGERKFNLGKLGYGRRSANDN